jgi:hypothetical protein
MTYDVRLVSLSNHSVSIAQLQSLVDDCRLEVVEDDGCNWSQVLVTSLAGDEICMLGRAGKRGMAREIDWLLDDLRDRQPRSSAIWAANYLRSARALYGCSYLSFGLSSAHASVPSSLMWAIQTIVGGGILHAEGQGFSNEDGYQITWEFSDKVAGHRQMAVLGSSGRWHTFEMDLADARHRDTFRMGECPFGVEMLELH